MPSNSILPATDKTHPIIFSYIGSPAVLDGKINNNDKWNEGEKTVIKYGNTEYELISKHDKENLYIYYLEN